ncbi:MAG: membrane protein insertion efficiency factor YidD [Blastochloris sp.]|nr:membrane protein insertion efficiency factor YidD [Blastochloris sp.]
MNPSPRNSEVCLPWPRRVAIVLLRAYQQFLSPLKIFFGVTGGSCRFTPTCSEYAVQAIEKRGLALGIILGLWRILRCQPWGGQGYDPVPLKQNGTPQRCGCHASPGTETRTTHLAEKEFHG